MGTAPGGLKDKLRSMWITGDFGRIAIFQAAEAERFVGRLGLRPGARVLDVACGTGNLAIPAARLGAARDGPRHRAESGGTGSATGGRGGRHGDIRRG